MANIAFSNLFLIFCPNQQISYCLHISKLYRCTLTCLDTNFLPSPMVPSLKYHPTVSILLFKMAEFSQDLVFRVLHADKSPLARCEMCVIQCMTVFFRASLSKPHIDSTCMRDLFIRMVRRMTAYIAIIQFQFKFSVPISSES